MSPKQICYPDLDYSLQINSEYSLLFCLPEIDNSKSNSPLVKAHDIFSVVSTLNAVLSGLRKHQRETRREMDLKKENYR